MNTRSAIRMAAALTVCTSVIALAGCANLGVRPWEREHHARPDMSVSEQPLVDAIEDHTWFSKEAASGGRSFGGGGCGCN